MQDYKKDCIELHDLTSEDVSEIDELTDHWEDVHIFETYTEALEEIVNEYLIAKGIEVDDSVMQFLDIEGYANYTGLSHDLHELASGKAVQSF